MGERTTGATPAQIEAAVAKWETCPEKDVPAFRRVVTGYAEDLVPPGSLIFGPEDIAALRRVLDAYKAAIDALNILWEGTANAADAHDDRRLAALIGDDGNG
jgi:hypothetical protein